MVKNLNKRSENIPMKKSPQKNTPESNSPEKSPKKAPEK